MPVHVSRPLAWKRTPLTLPALRSTWYRLRSSSGRPLHNRENGHDDGAEEAFDEKADVVGDVEGEEEGTTDVLDGQEDALALYPDLYPVLSSTSTLLDDEEAQSSDDAEGYFYDGASTFSSPAPSARSVPLRHPSRCIRLPASPRPDRPRSLSVSSTYYDSEEEDDRVAHHRRRRGPNPNDSVSSDLDDIDEDDVDDDPYAGKLRGTGRFTSPEMLRLEEEYRGRSRQRRMLWRSAPRPSPLALSYVFACPAGASIRQCDIDLCLTYYRH
jgi:hypothetical protein